jgi:hypothetical protein
MHGTANHRDICMEGNNDNRGNNDNPFATTTFVTIQFLLLALLILRLISHLVFLKSTQLDSVLVSSQVLLYSSRGI